MWIVDPAQKARAALDGPISVGGIGADFMAQGLTNRIVLASQPCASSRYPTAGPERAVGVFKYAGCEDVVAADSQYQFDEAAAHSRFVATDDAMLLMRCAHIDVLAHVTGWSARRAGRTRGVQAWHDGLDLSRERYFRYEMNRNFGNGWAGQLKSEERAPDSRRLLRCIVMGRFDARLAAIGFLLEYMGRLRLDPSTRYITYIMTACFVRSQHNCGSDATSYNRKDAVTGGLRERTKYSIVASNNDHTPTTSHLFCIAIVGRASLVPIFLTSPFGR
jgi:hypothetical protein